MPKNVAVGALVTAVLACATVAARGQTPEAQPAQAATLNYTIDAGLIYIDRLTRPPHGGSIGPVARTSTAAALETPRTLGLDRMRIAMDWETQRSASLHLVLRPDSANRRDESASPVQPRETDSRAGDDPYRPAPTIRLLDAYQLTLKPGTSLAGSFGVFEGLALPPPAYPETLGFGLAVSLPAKFSGARGRWERAPEAGQGQLSAEVYVIQGDEDRAEAFGLKAGTRDSAPVARDPYAGGAAHLSWIPSQALALEFVGGYLEGADAGTRRSEVMAQLTAASKIPLSGKGLNLGLDGRYAQERWRGAPLDPRTQHSLVLTAAWHLSNATAVLLGAMQGKTEHATDSVSGFGIEAGVLRSLGQGLTLQLMLSHEKRERKTPGAPTLGGFHDADGNHGTARRMGLELSYLLNDNV